MLSIAMLHAFFFISHPSRHLISRSVRGADYGSVRVGAYMGRKMIKSMASSILSQSVSNGNGGHPEELEDEGIELLATEASLDYLCNLSPHRWEHKWLNPSSMFSLSPYQRMIS